jgi:uncharacterized protein with PIN domain
MAVDLEDRGHALENEYFRRKEQELIEKMRAKIGSEDSRQSGMQCPRCDGNLHETNYENVKIDVCDKCSGVWLDAGELAQIAHKDESTGWFGRAFS